MTLDFKVPNLACSACVEAVTKAVKAVDSGAKVAADPKRIFENTEMRY